MAKNMLKPSLLDIWSVDLRYYESSESALNETLSYMEKEKASRFKFEYLRRNYVLSHGILRCLIAYYLNLNPVQIEFFYGPFGKPFLPNKTLYFNMSHSHHMALYAFSKKSDVGVDIEYINPATPIDEVLFSVFPQHEQANIMNLSSEAKKQAFYEKWTRAEAYLKAKGTGLINDFDTNEIVKSKKWKIFDVPLSLEYAGAVAYESALIEKNLGGLPIIKIRDAKSIDIPPTRIGIL